MADAVEQLIEAMNQELQCQRELAGLLENKLDAMRRYDVRRLDAIAANEHRLIDNLHTNSQRRNTAVRLVAQQLFGQPANSMSAKSTPINSRSAKSASTNLRSAKPVPTNSLPTARQIAEKTSTANADKIIALTAMLKDVTQTVKRLSGINATASQKMLGHFDHIFRIIAQSGRDIGLYGRAGTKFHLEQNRLFDALA